jgi:hypothetical protein
VSDGECAALRALLVERARAAGWDDDASSAAAADRDALAGELVGFALGDVLEVGLAPTVALRALAP